MDFQIVQLGHTGLGCRIIVNTVLTLDDDFLRHLGGVHLHDDLQKGVDIVGKSHRNGFFASRTGRHWNRDAAQLEISLGQSAFPLQNIHAHASLVVSHGPVFLGTAGRNDSVAFDNRVEVAAFQGVTDAPDGGVRSQGIWTYVGEDDFLNIPVPLLHGSLQGCADDDSFVRVDAGFGRAAHEAADETAHQRQLGGSAYQHHFIDVIQADAGIPERPFDWLLNPFEEQLTGFFVFFQGYFHMKRLFIDYCTEDNLILLTEFFLRFFCLTFQVGQGFQRHFPFIDFKFIDKHTVEHFREILTAQEVVTGHSTDFHNHIIQLQDGYIQGATAQVEDQIADFFVQVVLLVDSVGNGCGSRFIDNALHFETCQFAGFFRGLSLTVIEVGRYTDDRFGHLAAKVRLCILLQRAEDEGRQVFCTVFFALQFINSFCPHGTLKDRHRIGRIHTLPLQSRFPHIYGTFCVHADHRRGQQTAQPVGDDGYIPIFIYSHQTVGGSKVNSQNHLNNPLFFVIK